MVSPNASNAVLGERSARQIGELLAPLPAGQRSLLAESMGVSCQLMVSFGDERQVVLRAGLEPPLATS